MIPLPHVRPLLALAAAIVALAALLHVVLPAGAAAVPDARAPGPQLVPDSRVGAVEGTRAYVALAFDGRRLRVYVCDGDRRGVASLARWLEGRWNGRDPVTLRRDGVVVRIAAVLPDGRVRGTVTAFSGPHPFTAVPATGAAGLYDGADRRRGVRSTWIVLPDRSLRGAIVPTRPPRRVCRAFTVTLADGTTTTQTRCFMVS